jgi:fluoroacetyl-CoA thioesterase
MKPSLHPGATYTHIYVVPSNKTVPNLYPDAPEFAAMPAVFATGYMVGLMEWACMKVMAPHLDAGEGSLGIDINVNHTAATLPGQTITVVATCTEVKGRRLTFKVTAHDGIDKIGEGTHSRAVVPWDRFTAMVNAKAVKAGVEGLGVCPAWKA